MKRSSLFLFTALFTGATLVASSPKWINIYTTGHKSIGEFTRVTNVAVDSIDKIDFLSKNRVPDSFNACDSLRISLKNNTSVSLPTDSMPLIDFGVNLPLITITTDENVREISSKTEYLSGKVTIDGYGVYDSLDETSVNIRGRGNSTWIYPKKPYRLKFSKKQSLCGLKKAKNFVLIANYLDNTLMRNAISLKAAQLLGMPYTNHCIPVEVVLNGINKGSYMLSEKVGINAGSVDIDESSGIMWELDTSYDEDYKFISPYYSTKVMVKDPDFSEIAEEDTTLSAEALLEKWKMDYIRFEQSVVEDRWEETVDVASAVDYILVNHFSGNREVNHPKSVYLYKEHIDSLYKVGPVWDFDWGYNYINSPELPLFITKPNYVIPNIVKTPLFQKLFAERWEYFKKEIYPQLMEYFDEYAAMIRVSALKNGEIWPLEHWWRPNYDTTETFDQNLIEMKNWIERRMIYIDSTPYFGLFLE